LLLIEYIPRKNGLTKVLHYVVCFGQPKISFGNLVYDA